MTCRELVEFLDDYLAGELPSGVRRQIEAHLAGCPSCGNYLHSYRDTIRLTQLTYRHPDASVPSTVPEHLIDAILAARKRRSRS